MKTLSGILMVLVMLMAAGCAGGVGPAAQAPTVDITGKWTGTWVATNPALGSGVVVKQTGAQYSGNLLVTGAPTHPTGPTQGTVSGNEVRVIQPGNFTGGLIVQATP